MCCVLSPARLAAATIDPISPRLSCEKAECTRCTIRAGRPPQFWRSLRDWQRELDAVDVLLTPSEASAARNFGYEDLSPREKGNSAVLAERAAQGARDAGAVVESIYLHGMDIRPCDGCDLCSAGACVIPDDMQSLYPKLAAAEGAGIQRILLATCQAENVRHRGLEIVGVSNLWEAWRQLTRMERILQKYGDAVAKRWDELLKGKVNDRPDDSLGLTHYVEPHYALLPEEHNPIYLKNRIGWRTDDGPDMLGVADVAGVEAQLVYAGLQGDQGLAVVKVDVRRHRNGTAANDLGEGGGSFPVRGGQPHQLTAGLCQGGNLRRGRGNVRCGGAAHRLDDDGRPPTEGQRPYLDGAGDPARGDGQARHQGPRLSR